MTLGDHYNGNAAVHEDRYTYVFIQSILGSLSFLDLSKKDEGAYTYRYLSLRGILDILQHSDYDVPCKTYLFLL